MPPYCDQPRKSPGSNKSAQAKRAFPAGRMFIHLKADTEKELREYAAKQQIPLKWIQRPGTTEVHFDLTGVLMQRVLADVTVEKCDPERFVQKSNRTRIFILTEQLEEERGKNEGLHKNLREAIDLLQMVYHAHARELSEEMWRDGPTTDQALDRVNTVLWNYDIKGKFWRKWKTDYE